MPETALFEASSTTETVMRLARSLIQGLLGSPAVAARRHPLGFLHLALPGARRLHIWPTERTPQDANLQIHDHVFGFTSRVLVGSIENVLYDVVERSDGSHQLMRVEYSDGQSMVVPTGQRVALRESERLLTPQFGLYSVQAGTFHKSRVADGAVACSILTYQEAGLTQPRVVGPVGRQHDMKFAREIVPEGEIRSLLSSLQAALDEQPV